MKRLFNFCSLRTGTLALMAMLMFFFISSCGGSGSGAPIIGTVSGFVVNGPIAGAEVRLYDLNNRVIGAATSGDDGSYRIEGAPISTGFRVEAKGGRLYGRDYSGILKSKCRQGVCNITPLSTLISDYADEQKVTDDEAENTVIVWLGLTGDEDPFFAASQGRKINEHLDLTSIRNTIKNDGLDKWNRDTRALIVAGQEVPGWPGPLATKDYDITADYQKDTIVSYKGKSYINQWWASHGQCPVKADCTEGFVAGLWKIHDPNVKHEFAWYDYQKIKTAYPAIAVCTQNDYLQATVKNLIDQRIANGDLAFAGPFANQDSEALYREYMLTCRPDLNQFKPANVVRVENILTPAVWTQLASKIYDFDSKQTYIDADKVSRPWPAEDGFVANARNNFLSAVARYPYFCGEQGYLISAEEACKRELASLFAHAAQETGGGSILNSFQYLRETGFVDTLDDDKFRKGCKAPFDCSDSWANYYGRGPKQLTYYYNYAGFSAAYFNGNYNFLLKWPDMVAYDGIMFFQSAIWFVMANQPPKPSIHDLILGRYQPVNCITGTDCHGIIHDQTSGVKHNFNVTIDVVNGGPECRGKNKQQSKNRSDGYIQMLNLLGAVKIPDEQNPVNGCDFISTPKDGATFANSKLMSGLKTWIDLSQKNCKAQSYGGVATVSVTAPGIVDACRNP